MSGRRAIARVVVAVGVGGAILVPATAASAIPLHRYVGPYETLERCAVDQQFDPYAVGECQLRDGEFPGWYYKAFGRIGGEL